MTQDESHFCSYTVDSQRAAAEALKVISRWQIQEALLFRDMVLCSHSLMLSRSQQKSHLNAHWNETAVTRDYLMVLGKAEERCENDNLEDK